MNRGYVDFQSNIKESLKDIFEDFCDNQNLIDLTQTKKLIQEHKVKQSKLFLSKIDQVIKKYNKQIMNRDQFIQYFSTSDDEEHYSAVFDLIDQDKSTNISKKQLANMNQKYNIGLSKADIDAMITQISSDGQKVTKNQLIKFLAKNNK